MQYHCVVSYAGKMSDFVVETDSLAGLVHSLQEDGQQIIRIGAYTRRFDSYVPVLTARDLMPDELGRKWLKRHFPGHLNNIHDWIDDGHVRGAHSLLRTSVDKTSLVDALVEEARHHLLVPQRQGAPTVNETRDFHELFDTLEFVPAQLKDIVTLERIETFACLDANIIPIGRDADGQLLVAATDIIDEASLAVALQCPVRHVAIGDNVDDNLRMHKYFNRRFHDLHPDYQAIDATAADCYRPGDSDAPICRTEALFTGFAELLHGEDNMNTRVLRQVFRKGISGGAFGYEILVGEKIEAGHLYEDGKAGHDHIPRLNLEHHICRLAALAGISPSVYEDTRIGQTIECANGQLMLDAELWLGEWGPNLRMTWLLAYY